MTRRHYVALADALGSALGAVEGSQRDGIDFAVGVLAERLAADNPRFDRERFFAAVDAAAAARGDVRGARYHGFAPVGVAS